mgnify:CR=1 FL=1
MELKYLFFSASPFFAARSNRTFIAEDIEHVQKAVGSNRTFMELKCKTGQQRYALTPF